jgi:hypothetical protein
MSQAPRREAKKQTVEVLKVSAARYEISQAWAEGKGELATSRLRADSGQETDSVYFAMISIGRT